MSVAPEVLEWARERSGRSRAEIESRFPKFRQWISGESRPTLRQLEQFAAFTHTPIGMLFLSQPPEETVPLPDFRTFADQGLRTPTPDLLDTIYICEQRQTWFRRFAEENSYPRVRLVGSLLASMSAGEAAATLRDLLGFDSETRSSFPTWTDALSGLAEHAENAGVMVMVSGVVGTNTHRKLDPAEFRGFSLVDDLAPVVFINGADTKAAQIFTLAHELAHIGRGESAISNQDLGSVAEPNEVERWCNEVAAEFLVPIDSLTGEYDPREPVRSEAQRLAKVYKVSSLVVLRRMFDAGILDRNRYRREYRQEYRHVVEYLEQRGSGGNFYNAQPVRTSKRFARALISDTLEGGTLYRDAYRLLGFKKFSTFEEMSHRLGVA